jgi:hypothetical protein
MNNKPIRAFEALTVEDVEVLAVIGSVHDSTGKGKFFLDKFVRQRLAMARRLEAFTAPADAEEAQRLRLAAQVSMQEVGYIANCCHDDGEDPSVMHERIRKLPLRFAFAMAEMATAELELAWADAHASGRPLSEVIRPFVRIRDDDFTLEAEEVAHAMIFAWREGRPFGEVVEQFSPARGVQRRLIGAITRLERREPAPIPAGMGSGSEASPG